MTNYNGKKYFSEIKQDVLIKFDKRDLDKGGHFDIPSGVTKITFSAFENCRDLKSVVIPSGVKIIGERAFAGCVSLGKIAFSDDLTEIGHSAFASCRSLISVIIPNGVKRIRKGTFSWCDSLKSVTINGSTSVAMNAFDGCVSLKYVKKYSMEDLSVDEVKTTHNLQDEELPM